MLHPAVGMIVHRHHEYKEESQDAEKDSPFDCSRVLGGIIRQLVNQVSSIVGVGWVKLDASDSHRSNTKCREANHCHHAHHPSSLGLAIAEEQP